MTLATENLYRATNDFALVRAEADDGMPTMTGHFAVWDQWTPIRSVFENNGKPFLERFAPSSMTKTLQEAARMKVMFNHGKDPAIGEKLLGVPTRLEPDAEGALYEVPLFDTSYNRDLVPGLESGAYGASMRFSVEQERYVEKPPKSAHNPLGIPERTVTEARVAEFGPVSWPAYPGASAGLRSITDDVLFARFVDDPDKLLELLEAYKISRDAALSPAMRLGDVTYDNYTSDLEPEPSAATTPPRTEPEPPEATTRTRAPRAGIYPYREEKPSWLL